MSKSAKLHNLFFFTSWTSAAKILRCQPRSNFPSSVLMQSSESVESAGLHHHQCPSGRLSWFIWTWQRREETWQRLKWLFKRNRWNQPISNLFVIAYTKTNVKILWSCPIFSISFFKYNHKSLMLVFCRPNEWSQIYQSCLRKLKKVIETKKYTLCDNTILPSFFPTLKT